MKHALFMLLLALSACSQHASRLTVDPGGYYVRGDYIGSQHHVKLWVEKMRVQPRARARGSVVVADLCVLNERAEPAKLMLGKSRLEVNGRGYLPMETHIVALKPGELTHVTLSFETMIAQDELAAGAVRIDGIDANALGVRISFAFPFSRADES